MEGLVLRASRTEPVRPWLANRAGALAFASGLFAGALALATNWKLDTAERAILRVDSRADGLVPKGEEAAHGDVGVRAFRVIDGGRRVEEARTVLPDDTITFSYTNVRSSTRYLALLGMQAASNSWGAEEGAHPSQQSGTGWSRQESVVRWYYPEVGEPGSIPIKSGTVDEPLGDGFQLGLQHSCGWLRIVAIFSRDSIAASDLQEALLSLPQPSEGDDPFPSLSFAPNKNVLTHSIRLQIVCPQ